MYQEVLKGIIASYEELVEISIETLRVYEFLALRHNLEDGYFLGFSGGKDSVVIKDIARRAKVKHKSYYSNTTIDPPELVRFIKQYHKDVTWLNPKQNFFHRMEKKGLPTRLVRWCCEEYKERGGEAQVKIFGIRAAESKQRRDRWKVLTKWNKAKGGWVVNPILYWSDQDVWRYIRENKLPYCCLYDEGFSRLGCVGCPMVGKKRKNEFARWPKYEKLWRMGTRLYWERTHDKLNRKGKPYYCSRFKSPDEFFDWWLSDNPSPKDDDCQMGLF